MQEVKWFENKVWEQQLVPGS